MKFNNVVLIDGDKTIKVNETNFYAGPMAISDIEDIEDRLEQCDTAYLTAYLETTVETLNQTGNRYSKGYCVFVVPKKKCLTKTPNFEYT